MNTFPVDTVRFDDNGLIPVVVQHHATKDVLMMGFMNRDALLKTVADGRICFWSRSRQKFWIKGETSGMFLNVVAIRINCENNSLLIVADPVGPTCHTGHDFCYYREARDGEWAEIAPVVITPDALYEKK